MQSWMSKDFFFTDLKGGGPEVGVPPKQPALEGSSPRERREYDVGKGK